MAAIARTGHNAAAWLMMILFSPPVEGVAD